jgi:plasmid maintenance system antidote protein VapI
MKTMSKNTMKYRELLDKAGRRAGVAQVLGVHIKTLQDRYSGRRGVTQELIMALATVPNQPYKRRKCATSGT